MCLQASQVPATLSVIEENFNALASMMQRYAKAMPNFRAKADEAGDQGAFQETNYSKL